MIGIRLLHPAVQPTVCVMGYPVAGNPIQFAVERALAEVGEDWRFVSFNVLPEKFDEALRGAIALGFGGIAIADPFRPLARQQLDGMDSFDAESSSPGWIDSLHRHQKKWIGTNQLGRSVKQLCDEAIDAYQVLLVGESAKVSAVGEQFPKQQATRLSDLDDDESASHEEQEPKLVIVVDESHAKLADEDQEALDVLLNQAAVIVDLALERSIKLPDDCDALRISGLDVTVRSIINSLQDWTGKQVNADTVREAIEEYFEL